MAGQSNPLASRVHGNSQDSEDTMTQPRTHASQPKQQFNAGVRAYILRCFSENNASSEFSDVEVNHKAREIIQAAIEDGTVDTKDWGHAELPQDIMRRERRAAHDARIQTFSIAGLVNPRSTSDGSGYESHDDTNVTTFKKRKSTDDHHQRVPPPMPAASATVRAASNESDDLPSRNSRRRKNKKENKKEAKQEAENEQEAKRHRVQQRDGNGLSQRPGNDHHRGGNGLDQRRGNELEQRRQRFGNPSPVSPGFNLATQHVAAPVGPVVGLNQEIEKRYFRLTSAPKPAEVRPVPVLKQTLELLKQRWKSHKNYGYTCDQFKSMRQDLTVQRIRSSFTIEVYEVHARIALEKGDLGEYNQCQTQLRSLHRSRLGGNPDEFMAYRILYVLYTSNRPEMNSLLAGMTSKQRAGTSVTHALKLRSALALGDYHAFFKLYALTPLMGAFLVDMFLPRERIAALSKMCQS